MTLEKKSTMLLKNGEIRKNEVSAGHWNKNTVAILLSGFCLLTGTLTGVGVGFRILPDSSFSIRLVSHVLAAALSCVPFFFWILLKVRHPGPAIAILFSGIFFRFMGLLVLGAGLLAGIGFLRPVLLLYFIGTISFLFFEVVIITGMEFYARKRI